MRIVYMIPLISLVVQDGGSGSKGPWASKDKGPWVHAPLIHHTKLKCIGDMGPAEDSTKYKVVYLSTWATDKHYQ